VGPQHFSESFGLNKGVGEFDIFRSPRVKLVYIKGTVRTEPLCSSLRSVLRQQAVFEGGRELGNLLSFRAYKEWQSSEFFQVPELILLFKSTYIHCKSLTPFVKVFLTLSKTFKDR